MNSAKEKCTLDESLYMQLDASQIMEDIKDEENKNVGSNNASSIMPDKNKMELTTTAISANRLGTALGFLSNGYQYEVTGIMNLIFQLEYGNQYSSFLEYSLTGAPLFGVLIGQLFFGIVADIHGRKAGLVITSSFVVIGAIISTASYEGASLFTATWITLLTVVLMVLGPLASSFLIDILGRRNVQLIGWLSLASIIAITVGTYPLLFNHASVYVFLNTVRAALQYFLAVSIYLTPNEIFPTIYRARLYRFCSAFGKVGAAIGVHVFLSMQQSFGGGTKGLRGMQYFDAAFAILGLLVALLLVPDLRKTSLWDCNVNFMEMCKEDVNDSDKVRKDDSKMEDSKLSSVVKESIA
ncbi:MFS transporter, PHS family, inorganic phosphate transporter [Galdieria sulphuraria]|uniref:MFS transporter, PHS family, inorganic phosphate transporter n=1 Tax=Galdieria sulphuraria TaxID=130081 RepID=M2WX60_GALSU|nr:MFS transporter, PHS family, inorganic phosphate transporter [Galdieria sulphuraria]EME28610.1 MFS transporter, PHS family, inorganic phosphate transporter [Galdieria sulphuraria]|eukprot:XP_005705130.1 MFS transporter, PHS family, inorganic phosphate transporter [Galdieria sulphuraria]